MPQALAGLPNRYTSIEGVLLNDSVYKYHTGIPRSVNYHHHSSTYTSIHIPLLYKDNPPSRCRSRISSSLSLLLQSPSTLLPSQHHQLPSQRYQQHQQHQQRHQLMPELIALQMASRTLSLPAWLAAIHSLTGPKRWHQQVALNPFAATACKFTSELNPINTTNTYSYTARSIGRYVSRITGHSSTWSPPSSGASS